MDHIGDLCDLIQTLCHLTDFRKYPDMAQQVLGAYVAIFIEGDFSARSAIIKRYWRLVDLGDGESSLPTLHGDTVATAAFMDDTGGLGPYGEHEGAPRTLLEAYGDDPFWFDLALECAMSYACNLDPQRLDQRETILPYPQQLRRLQRIRMDLNSQHEDLLQRASQAGVAGALDRDEVQGAREGLVDISKSIEEHLLHLVATLAATHCVENDFPDTIRGVDTGMVLMSQALQRYRDMLTDLDGVLIGIIRSQRGVHDQMDATAASTQMREVREAFGELHSDGSTVSTVGSSNTTLSSHNSASSGEIPRPEYAGVPNFGLQMRPQMSRSSFHTVRLNPITPIVAPRFGPGYDASHPPEEKADDGLHGGATGGHGQLPSPPVPPASTTPPGPPASAVPPGPVPPAPTTSDPAANTSLTVEEEDIVETLIKEGFVTTKEWERMRRPERTNVLRGYRSVRLDDGLHHRLIKAFIPHAEASPDASLVERLTSGFLACPDGWKLLSKIISESAVPICVLAGKTHKVPAPGPSGKLTQVERGDMARNPTELVQMVLKAARMANTSGAAREPDDANLKDHNEHITQITDRKKKEIDDKNKNCKMHQVISRMIDSGTSDPDTVSALAWDYFIWMLTGNEQSQKSTGLSLPIDAILSGCTTSATFDEGTGLSGKSKGLFNEITCQLIRECTPEPEVRDDVGSAFDYDIDAFLTGTGGGDDDHDAPTVRESERESEQASGQTLDGTTAGPSSGHAKSIELHMWSRVVGLILILGPGLTGASLSLPVSVHHTSELCAAASSACIAALKHAWCDHVDANPQSAFSAKVTNSTTTNRENIIEMGRAFSRAVSQPFASKVRQWRGQNAGKNPGQDQLDMIAEVAYFVPKSPNHRSTALTRAWDTTSAFVDLPLPHPGVPGASTPPLLESIAIALGDQQAFSYPSVINWFLGVIAVNPNADRALKAMSLVAANMRGDVLMTVLDNMAVCEVLESFLALHGGFGEVQKLFESMGIEYVSVTADGTAKEIPRFCTAYSMKKMVLRYLMLCEEYRGGDHFATHFTQNSEAQLAIKNLDLDGLMSRLEMYKLISPQLRAQNAVSSAASARRLQKFTQTLNVNLKGTAAFSVLENLVGPPSLTASVTFGMGDDGGPSGSTPPLSSGPLDPPGSGTGSGGAPVVALFIPADVLSKPDGEAADYFDRQLATAVKADQAHQVFTVLAQWTKMAYSYKRMARDQTRPMILRLKQAIEKVLAGTSIANCLVVRPPKPDRDDKSRIKPETIYVAEAMQRKLAQSVCRVDKGTGGLAYSHASSLRKAQRGVADFCLTRFVSPTLLSRWPDTLFHILKVKFFPNDKTYTRDVAHVHDQGQRTEAIGYADKEFFAKLPTGAADSPHTLVLAWTHLTAPSFKTRNKPGHKTGPPQLKAPKQPRKKGKARVQAETETKEAADASAAEVVPDGAPPADAAAAGPPAGPPPTAAQVARLDAITTRLADLQAQEAAYQQRQQIEAVAKVTAQATADMTVDRLEARAMGAPAGNRSAQSHASQASPGRASPSADEVAAASRRSAIADIQAEMRAHGR